MTRIVNWNIIFLCILEICPRNFGCKNQLVLIVPENTTCYEITNTRKSEVRLGRGLGMKLSVQSAKKQTYEGTLASLKNLDYCCWRSSWSVTWNLIGSGPNTWCHRSVSCGHCVRIWISNPCTRDFPTFPFLLTHVKLLPMDDHLLSLTQTSKLSSSVQCGDFKTHYTKSITNQLLHNYLIS